MSLVDLLLNYKILLTKFDFILMMSNMGQVAGSNLLQEQIQLMMWIHIGLCSDQSLIYAKEGNISS